MVSVERQSFRLSRKYALISFIAVSITTVLIFAFFRMQTIQSIKSASEQSYTALTLAITHSMNDHFVEFFNGVESARKSHQPIPTIDAELTNTIQRLIVESNIERVKLYDRTGRVVYSTKQSQIGTSQKNNPGFISAIDGKPATKLIYKDQFNVFDQEIEDANLAQSYVPIIADRLHPAIGVFEIYVDVIDDIKASNRNQIGIFIFVTFVMTVLYLILMIFIKKGEKIINEQQRESRERQKTLEILSAKMITAQEDEKRRISENLHEDVVQSILAVKVHLENCIRTAKQSGVDGSFLFPDHIVNILQDSVSKIRKLSLDLRPPSLDNFGLSAATNTLVAEFKQLSESTRIKIKIDIAEERLTPEMKSILFRILKETLGEIVYKKTTENTVIVRLSYIENQEKIELEIEEGTYDDGVDQEYFEMMRERTILSGGEFNLSTAPMGKLKAHSAWSSETLQIS